MYKAKTRAFLQIAVAYCMIAVILVLMTPPTAVYAGKPTVTVTSYENKTTYRSFTISFTTVGGAKDTAFVYQTGTTGFQIGGIGKSDSIITLQVNSNFAESKKDSMKFGVIWDIGLTTSPTINQWSMAYHDSVTLKSKWPGGVARFNVRRYAGLANLLRVRIYELGTVAVSPQAVSALITLPRN